LGRGKKHAANVADAKVKESVGERDTKSAVGAKDQGDVGRGADLLPVQNLDILPNLF